MKISRLGRRRVGSPEELLRVSDTVSFDSIVGRAAILSRSGRVLAVNEAWRRHPVTTQEWGRAGIARGENYLSVVKEAATRGDEYAQTVLLGASSVLRGNVPAFSADYPANSGRGIRWFRLTFAPLSSDTGATILVITETGGPREIVELQGRSSGQSGPLFPLLVEAAANTIGASSAQISEAGLTAPATCSVLAHTTTLGLDGNGYHDRTGSPCADLGTGGFVYCHSGVQRRYPDAPWLRQLGGNGFADIAIHRSDGQFIGHLSVIHHDPLEDGASIESAMRLFAARASAELERLQLQRERDQTAARAEYAETQYKTVFDSVTDAVLVLSQDSVVLEVNRGAERLYGCRTSDLTGRSAYDMGVGPDVVDNLFREVLANGHWEGAGKIARRDGTQADVEARITKMTLPGTNNFVAVVRDVSSEIEAEAQAALERGRTRALLDGIPDLIFCLNREGVYLDFRGGQGSQPYMAKEQFLGRNIRDVMPTDVADRCMAGIAQALDTVTTVVVEYDLEQEGEIRHYECRIVPLGDDEVMAIVRDYTAERRLAGEAKRRAALEDLETQVDTQILRRNPYRLTFRELTVLHLLAEGATDKEIAERLSVSIFTVNKHVANILGKMQAGSRTEAAVRASREGLVG